MQKQEYNSNYFQMSRKSNWKHRLAAVLISCFMLFFVLLLGELYCRLFTNIDFLENSKELFTPNRYGRSWGNTPNLEGIASGQVFHIDADGFRADPEFTPTAPANAPAILIVGDSVSFGVALKDYETVSAHLRRAITGRRFYDSSAIGYSTSEYKNVVDSLIKQKPDIKTVVLFFCLNDIDEISAAQIKQQMDPGVILQEEAKTLPRAINQFLRTRSKLYLLIKKHLQNTQMMYFQADAQRYRDDEAVKHGMRYMADVKRTLDEAGVRLKVFILPYEVQLRPGSPDDFLMPQRKIVEYLRASNIDYYDTTTDLRNAGLSEDLYLFDDPMHLSAKGHKILADIVCNNLGEMCAAAP